MIKFDHDKVNFSNSDRIEPNDPQFLTFRNNASNNTGRSIFSQKIELYKSLQKDSKQQQEEQMPVRNFKKANNLRSVRSQQKYLGKQFVDTKKAGGEKRLFQGQMKDKDGNQQANNQTTANEFKNELLRKKIQKLAKNIKNQQKKQTSLQKEIGQLQKELQDDQKQIQNQQTEIQQLQSINDQNQLYLNKLAKNFQELEGKNDHLESLVQKIQDSLENLLNSSRQEDAKSRMAHKLKEGLVRLESLKSQVSNRCFKMHTEIQNLKQFIEQSQNLDLTIRDTAYTKEAQNNSHFTC